ncbi:MAG: tRNA (5-methylaminomethyl-2-thiouridine)(34)-methyltransferase MnmD [Saprospiraceae bacterium]|nr:tRNA (5-methylaminomethyl-2-thiouridine)(34)-methyltransferase MnmD [Candidatus Vicinibacter affinis]MBK8642911.1 tRNA (5-methylaminomethyl-2-thiouridine)(34)-methyltransferase MnmD [Candidatus Vicinibacter affinis]MBP6172272.1 tRNA (5-methylaminomethyl-2-thiouridine)(34)-methyltransferase MnmD [Saprospiraceae bacterium]
MIKPVIFNSADGSDSVLHPIWNSYYHSKHGALSESLKVYIEYGLAYRSQIQNSIKIFEFGFGTGLNAYLTLLFAIQNGVTVNYQTIENMPLLEDTWSRLNYPNIQTALGSSNEYFQLLHRLSWGQEFIVCNNFLLTKNNSSFESFKPDSEFDIIYFDAFGPEIQPDLWTLESLEKLYFMLAPGGILLTFCAKGQFKRDLRSLGFIVEALSGPIGKREVTRAIKL